MNLHFQGLDSPSGQNTVLRRGGKVEKKQEYRCSLINIEDSQVVLTRIMKYLILILRIMKYLMVILRIVKYLIKHNLTCRTTSWTRSSAS